MSFKSIVLVFVFFGISISANSQVVHAFDAGDTLYRYKTNLYRDYKKFKDIRLSNLQFPCAEEIKVTSSERTDATLELESNLSSDIVYLKGATMYIVEYRGIDPFFGLPDYTIKLENKVPISRSTHKDDFYNKVKSKLVLEYAASDLKGEIRVWADKNNVTELKVSATLQWTTKYKYKDSFDNLDENIEGFVVENDKIFSVNKLEVKSDTWTTVEMANDQVLSDVFSPKQFNYYSFFDYRSLAEMARINLLPVHSFEYNTLERIRKSAICNDGDRKIYVFPNPTYGPLRVKFFNSKKGQFRFKLINIIGKSIWSHSFFLDQSDQEILLPMPDLSKGIYLYVIENSEGERLQSRRITIVNP